MNRKSCDLLFIRILYILVHLAILYLLYRVFSSLLWQYQNYDDSLGAMLFDQKFECTNISLVVNYILQQSKLILIIKIILSYSVSYYREWNSTSNSVAHHLHYSNVCIDGYHDRREFCPNSLLHIVQHIGVNGECILSTVVTILIGGNVRCQHRVRIYLCVHISMY